MNVVTRSIIGFAMLASSGSAVAITITGTIDGVHTEFYREDIWQIISDATPDTKAEKNLLSKRDKKFVRQIGSYQKQITKLQEKAEIRELKETQANRLLTLEDRLVQSLQSRNLLDGLLLAGLDVPDDFVRYDQTDSGITDYTFQEPLHETSVPEPSTLTLLALGLLCLGVAHGKHAYRPPS
jgi:PEP-CTERM motif